MKNLILSAFFAMTLVYVNAQVEPIFSTSKGAIRGYDPVAYFVQQKPLKGDKSISHKWQGAIWYFSSESNKSKFVENPDKYAPQYGGYWAFAMGHNQTANIDPLSWEIEDGKLYLNYNSKIQEKWKNDKVNLIRSADENWKNFDKKKY